MKRRLTTFFRVFFAILFVFSLVMLMRQYLDKRNADDAYERAQMLALRTKAPSTEAPATEVPATEAPATEPPSVEISETAAPPTGFSAPKLPPAAGSVKEEPVNGSLRIEPPILPAPQIAPPPTPAPSKAPAAEPSATKAPQWAPAPIEGEDEHIAALEMMDITVLQEINPDVIGWIFIPDTKVNYPILQGEDNDFYLNHTWEKKSNTVGSIFMEHLNAPDLTDFNTLLYGHNMADGSMFASIRQFVNKQYFRDHPYVYIVLPDQVLRYTVFSAYEAPIDSSVYGLSFYQEQTQQNFLTNALEQSAVQTELEPALTDRFLTLSTCTSYGYATRFVLQAYMPMIPE